MWLWVFHDQALYSTASCAIYIHIQAYYAMLSQAVRDNSDEDSEILCDITNEFDFPNILC